MNAYYVIYSFFMVVLVAWDWLIGVPDVKLFEHWVVLTLFYVVIRMEALDDTTDDA